MYPKMTMDICEPSLGNEGDQEEEEDSLVSEEGLQEEVDSQMLKVDDDYSQSAPKSDIFKSYLGKKQKTTKKKKTFHEKKSQIDKRKKSAKKVIKDDTDFLNP